METPPESTPSDTPLPPIDPDQRKPRAVLSCITCRTRKLRCDKGRPCRNCSKRNQVCRYYTFTSSGRNISPATNQNPPRAAHDLSRRLQHLEDLLVILNDQQESERRRNSSTTAGGLGSIHAPSDPEDCVEPDHSSDGSHTARPASSRRTSSSRRLGEQQIAPGQWQAALDDIAELRLFLIREPPTLESSRQPIDDFPLQDPVLLLSTLAPTTKADLMASLPPRSIVDQMISKIFSYEEPALIVIHTPTFMEEYEHFWTAPHSAFLAWLAKLFGLLCLCAIFQNRQGETKSDQTETINSFRVCAAQSLIMANYTRPGPHKFEALIVYMASEYFKSKDAQLGVSMLISIIVRLAMLMGYHRDPGRDSSISVFECEMIRRRWAFIAPVERLTSFQMGLPPILPRALTDTLPPLNILDTDINPSSTIPPPERPEWEQTPMSYILAKGRITRVFAMIMEYLYVSKPVPYKAILQIDMHLQNARSLLPPLFKILPVLQTYFEPQDLIMKRYYLELLYLKGRCLLHPARRILRHQADIHREIQPSGILHSSPWFLLSLTTSDFLLAAMIIGLSISQRMQLLNADHDVAPLGFPSDEDEQVALLQELGTSQRIWMSLSQKSSEASRAAEAIGLIVAQAHSVSRCRANDAPLPYLFTTDPVTPLAAGTADHEDRRMSSIVNTTSTVNWESWDRYFGAAPFSFETTVPVAAAAVPALPVLPQDSPPINELSDSTFDPGFLAVPFDIAGQ